jgi:hypothetical protein
MPLPVMTHLRLAYICRMCEHMGAADDKGLDDCGKENCGGPLVGRNFPDYKGPLSQILRDMCFCCGAESEQLLEVDGKEALGVCHRCVKNLLDKEPAEE